MKWIGRLIGMGLLIWLVPFASSLGWYDKAGKPMISSDLLRAIIRVVVLSTRIEKLLRRSPHV